MKIIVAPNSFKGTMSSYTAGSIIQEEIKKVIPNADVVRFSIADGGEGTIDAFFENFKGEYVEDTFTDSNFEKQNFKYVTYNNTAVIESGQCAGLIFTKVKNPMHTTTLGMGEQIMHAISNGTKNIIIALGGSATNDGGAGFLVGLGAKFFNENNKEFTPVGGTLKDITKVDISELEKNTQGIKFTVITDVFNTLYGENGAAYVYAKQKGASDEEIVLLDNGLRHFAEIIKNQFGIDVSTVEGGGAAGGIGAGCFAFLNTKIISGIDMILDMLKFDTALENADMVITGEGRFDNQSMMGKAVYGIAKRTAKRNIPLIIFTGKNEFKDQNILDRYLTKKVYEISPFNQTFQEIKESSEDSLRNSVGVFIDDLTSKVF